MPCLNCTCSSCLTSSPVIPESVTPAPPTHLGTTNHCLTNSDASYLEEIIKRAHEAFLIIDEKSTRVKALLDGLLKERARLLKTISEHRAILSSRSLRRFPAEILGEIFMAYAVLKGMFAPILLSRLCSRWRSVALSTPRLWSKLTAVVNSENKSRIKTLLENYIARSGQVPLDVTIRLGWGGKRADLDDIIRDVLLPQAHRWEYMSMEMPPDLHLALAPMLKGRLRSLKSVTFMYDNCDHEKMHLVDCYLGAPKITSAITTGICHLPLPLPQLLNWETSATMDICHSLLRRAENLVDWNVKLLPPSNVSHPGPPPANFQHSRLTSLNVEFSNSCHVSKIGFFFSALTLPSLQHLLLTTARHNSQLDVTSQNSIIAFLQRSSPPLVTFRAFLGTLPHSDDFLIACLESTPSLVELKIHILHQNKGMVTDQFMRRLNIKYRGFILPKLERLSLEGYMRFTAKSIAAMVASRRTATAQTQDSDVSMLRHLSLDLNRVQKSSPLEALQPFISSGLQVECRVSGHRH